MPIDRQKADQLATQGCMLPGCDHTDHDGTVFLHCRQHLGGRTEVSYRYGTGLLRVGCKECGKAIGVFELAGGADDA